MPLTQKSVLHHALVLIILSTCFIGAGTALTVFAGSQSGSIELDFGESQQNQITIYNPREEEDTVRIRVTPSMNNGELMANLLVDGRQTDVRDIKIGAEKNRTIQVLYTAARCTVTQCDGDLTFTARSLESGAVSTQQVPVIISRKDEVYGAPGLTGLEVLVAMLFAGTVFFFYTRPKK